jgi:hypothetical protein
VIITELSLSLHHDLAMFIKQPYKNQTDETIYYYFFHAPMDASSHYDGAV